MDEARLIDKLRLIEALFSGASTEGEVIEQPKQLPLGVIVDAPNVGIQAVLLSSLFLTILCICGAGTLGCGAHPDGYDSPGARGRYLAGTLADFAPTEDGSQMPVQVWYPVDPKAGEEKEHAYDVLGLTSGMAVESGPASCPKPRPVVVFSHGYSGLGYQTYSLTEHLARHGYVVVAPDHLLNSVFDLDKDMTPAVTLRRPVDVARAFDWLLEQSARPGSILSGCVDPSQGYAVMGHSFGAFTALVVAGAPIDVEFMAEECEGKSTSGCSVVQARIDAAPDKTSWYLDDPRAWAAVSMTPGYVAAIAKGLGEIALPTFVIGAEHDNLTPWETEALYAYQGLSTTPRFLAGFAEAGHYSFTDMCEILQLFGEGENGCGEGFRPVEEVLATLRVMVLAFLDHIRGLPEARGWLPPEEGLFEWDEVPR